MTTLIKTHAFNYVKQFLEPLLPKHCLDQFITQNGLMDTECMSLVFSKLLGYVIIAGSALVKIPQILKIVTSKSAVGVSYAMYYLETITCTLSTFYYIRRQFPFSTYGETVFLCLQNYFLLFLIYYHSSTPSATTKSKSLSTSTFLLSFLAYLGLVAFLYTADMSVLTYLQSFTIPIFVASRLSQIISTYRLKSTGQQSFITAFLNAIGGFARIFTTLREVKDTLMLLSVSLSTGLNIIILLQMFVYWKNTSTLTKVEKQRKQQ
jgi:mannose-P-dolichol utilization defect protein 1